MVFLSLVIVVGVVISLRINSHRLPGKGRFRRVRRLRSLTPMPDGTTVEETIVETRVEQAPTEEEEEA